MRFAVSLFTVVLAIALSACAGKGADDVEEPIPQEGGYTTTLYGRVKAGQGSGVVGVPLEGVTVTIHHGERSLGPFTTDASGSLTLDALPLFPEGTVDSPETLNNAEPVNAEVHFELPGYRPTVEIVTFPVDKYREFTFYLKGENF